MHRACFEKCFLSLHVLKAFIELLVRPVALIIFITARLILWLLFSVMFGGERSIGWRRLTHSSVWLVTWHNHLVVAEVMNEIVVLLFVFIAGCGVLIHHSAPLRSVRSVWHWRMMWSITTWFVAGSFVVRITSLAHQLILKRSHLHWTNLRFLVFSAGIAGSKVVFCGLFHSTCRCHTELMLPLLIYGWSHDFPLGILPMFHVAHVMELLMWCGSSAHESGASISILVSRHILESCIKWRNGLVKVSNWSNLLSFHGKVLLVGGGLSHETSHTGIAFSPWIIKSLPVVLHVSWCPHVVHHVILRHVGSRMHVSDSVVKIQIILRRELVILAHSIAIGINTSNSHI
jgi:hypothetical protein